MPPVNIKKPRCSRKAFEEKRCTNYQAITFNDGTKKKTLYFKSVKDREHYYKKSLRLNKKYSKFVRHSVLNEDKTRNNKINKKSKKSRKSRKSRKSKKSRKS